MLCRLLRVQNGNCCYDKACAMVECVVDILNELPIDARNQYNKACIYIEIAVLLFAKSNYEQVGTSVDTPKRRIP